MRAAILVAALIVGAAGAAGAAGSGSSSAGSASAGSASAWDAALSARLEKSQAYRQAELKLAAAELAERKYSAAYVPTIAIGTDKTGIGLADGAFTGASIVPSLTMSGLLGADLSLSAPVTISPGGAVAAGDPSLTLTRKLVVEDAADREAAEAALIRARASLIDAKEAAELQLATDVLNVVYYTRLLEANRGDLEVLERTKAAMSDATDATTRREIDRRILQARKSILSAQSSLDGQDAAIVEKADELYEAVKAKGVALAAALSASTSEISGSAEIRALRLESDAADRRSALAVLPYIPNPSFSAGLSYDVDKAKLGWSLTMQVSLTLLDKGERALASLQRKEGAAVARLALDDAVESLADDAKKAKDALASLEYDRDIKALDVADEEDSVATLESLYGGGYSSEEDLVVGRIDLSVARLAALKIDHDILLQRMKLASLMDGS